MAVFKKMASSLYVQVLIAITLGVLLGYAAPEWGEKMKPFGDGFIKLIKMVIAPIIFCTVVSGIAGMEDIKRVGRVGGKALIYFEVLTTVALIIGLLVVNITRPGEGMNADLSTVDVSVLAAYTKTAHEQTVADFLLHTIPDTVIGAFAHGEILQVLLFSVLFGFALTNAGMKAKPLVHAIDQAAHGFFGVVNIIMRLAPVGAFGAMAFTIGKYGIGALANLGELILTFYLTCFIFIFVILGIIAKICGFSIGRFLYYIREEILIVLGTSSSESVLPRMIAKLEALGCSRPVVGMVIPTGYSFNLDGSSIYFTMAALFIAQASNTPLTLTHQLTLLAVLLLTSKGAAGVTGSGFITLAATLSSVHVIPVAGLALILGIDRFMSEARAITNLIGNGVATVVVAKWEGELDKEKMQKVLAGNQQ